jgi:alpha-tubulin suppressor-like RCC1 family protein
MKNNLVSSCGLRASLCAIAAIFSWHSLLAGPAGRGVGWGAALTSPGIIVTNIAARGDHNLALRNDGTIIAWGDAAFTPTSAGNVLAVAAGGDSFSPQSNFGLALTTNGTVLGWNGPGFYSQTPPAGLSNVVAISAGARHSLALKSDGTVVGWGDNSQLQLNFPFGLTNVVAISAGEFYSLALKNNGTAVASGNSHPVPADATNLIAIAVGYAYGLGLKANGTVLLWNSSSSQQLPNLTNAVGIAVGDDPFSYHVLALRSDGTVYTFGDNSYGQSSVPAGLSNVVAIAAGPHHSVALKNDGAVVCWGENTWGKTNFPTCVNDIVAVSAGAGYNLALKRDGTISDWLGNQTLPAGLSNITAVAAGIGNGLALRKDGTVKAWGNNGSQQVSGLPPGLNGVAAVAMSTYHAFAVKSNGTVIVWGYASGVNPGAGVLPANLTTVVAVSASLWNLPAANGGSGPGDFALALKNDGTVVGWGDNNTSPPGSSGPTNVPAGLSNVVAIAAGGFHALALKNDSTVIGWGYNRHGEATGIPTPSSPYMSTGQVMVAGQVISNVIAIAAGFTYSLALKNDGTVVAWGTNTDGEATIPPAVSNVVAISAGFYQSLAIIADLKIDSIRIASQGPALNFHAFAGQQYSVEYSPDLTSGSWSPLPGGNVSGTGLDTQVIDTAGVGAASRFYRLRLLP